MQIAYVRFINTVGSPGNAGSNIAKARVRRMKEETIARDEEMSEITIEGPFVVLRAFRRDGKREVLRERFTPFTNVIDFEPLEVEAPAKKNKEGSAQ